MRKLVLLGVVLALSSGCGRGWLPIFRGAPCNSSGCGAPAMPASYDSGCANCGTSSGYGEYNVENSSEIFGSENGYYPGVDSGYSSPGVITSPPMSPLSQPAS